MGWIKKCSSDASAEIRPTNLTNRCFEKTFRCLYRWVQGTPVHPSNPQNVNQSVSNPSTYQFPLFAELMLCPTKIFAFASWGLQDCWIWSLCAVPKKVNMRLQGYMGCLINRLDKSPLGGPESPTPIRRNSLFLSRKDWLYFLSTHTRG